MENDEDQHQQNLRFGRLGGFEKGVFVKQEFFFIHTHTGFQTRSSWDIVINQSLKDLVVSSHIIHVDQYAKARSEA